MTPTDNSSKILVTGGAGFIGSHTVVSLVEAGFEPVIVDDFSNSERSALDGLRAILGRDVTCYPVDCNDAAAMDDIFQKEAPLGVIHFAAFKAVGESVAQPLKYYRNNLDSLMLLLELMPKHNIRNFVFSSSCTVYGQPEQLPVTEATPRLPAQSPYGNTKSIGEDIIRDAVRAQIPVKAFALRYFNPIGAHPSAEIGELPLGVPANLVPFITQTAAGIRSSLTVYGSDYNTPDGTCIRDYIDVMDLADAHVQALRKLIESDETASYDVINIGTGRGETVLNVIKTFEEATGMKLNYILGPRRPGDVEQVYADVSKANQVLGWTARRSLADSLRDAWRWQQKIS
ncbi:MULTISPECIES: UDP-glucose 4-epimerase GalE [unclassified Spirosoma]|uniref:UDP-glucose 4-epimerase GalE n=1 Tax=unclassified Spirosoma TaxID=2621999 RepID=UPI00096A07AA|nr:MULTISPECIES: UDP-glucose 4-epimerase GalE [unclassified Spirosoma]MBN8824599.1 UDP-glucose 4-epimerase GalE [Spirosoma sp.]OJW70957.1 MAG: UDP-glucose 4-epimerase GalE [Spirosoma sp. 48-14]